MKNVTFFFVFTRAVVNKVTNIGGPTKGSTFRLAAEAELGCRVTACDGGQGKTTMGHAERPCRVQRALTPQ